MTDENVISVTEILSQYDQIRGTKPGDVDFWDLVVLSTADDEQKKAYEIQLYEKLQRKELPLDVPYHVFSDPHGPKVGNGGSIMHCLHLLTQTYGEKFFKLRVIIIPAGGQSQRLPSASVLGKIFTALPTGKPMYQMLDLKLALSLPFVKKMQPGVFISGADTIEVYNFGKDPEWSFENPGFTVLAHPSTIEIGKGHGVYVIENPEKLGKKDTEFAMCSEVLQKPSEAVMREKGAVVSEKNPTGDGVPKEVVYTDSIFFFDHSISKKLAKFYEDILPLPCEIDGYGDFLQALGPRATIDYTNNVSNVSSVHPDLIPTREKIFNLLKGTQLNVVMLNKSKFYHIGSTKEYLHHYCSDDIFSKELDMNKQIMAIFQESNDQSKKPCLEQRGRVLHSKLPAQSAVDPTSVIEYCNFDVPIVTSPGCIVSNCCYLLDDISSSATAISLNHNTFIHTVPVLHDSQTKFVTIIFSTQDNLKKKVEASLVGELLYFGKSLNNILPLYGVNSATKFFAPSKPTGLWYAKLFPIMPSMTESLKTALQVLKIIYREESSKPNLSDYICLSMDDILHSKDVVMMLDYRKDLYKKLH